MTEKCAYNFTQGSLYWTSQPPFLMGHASGVLIMYASVFLLVHTFLFYTN